MNKNLLQWNQIVFYKLDSLLTVFIAVDKVTPFLHIFFIIRYHTDILGIKKKLLIEGIEYKLSQYADDTSLFSGSSPESMNGTCIPRILNFIPD